MPSFETYYSRFLGRTGAAEDDFPDGPPWEEMSTDESAALSAIEHHQALQASYARKDLERERRTPQKGEDLLPDKRVPAPPCPGFERLDKVMMQNCWEE